MNHKILKILEYPRITEKLAQEAITDTAKKQARDLQPVSYTHLTLPTTERV